MPIIRGKCTKPVPGKSQKWSFRVEPADYPLVKNAASPQTRMSSRVFTHQDPTCSHTPFLISSRRDYSSIIWTSINLSNVVPAGVELIFFTRANIRICYRCANNQKREELCIYYTFLNKSCQISRTNNVFSPKEPFESFLSARGNNEKVTW